MDTVSADTTDSVTACISTAVVVCVLMRMSPLVALTVNGSIGAASVTVVSEYTGVQIVGASLGTSTSLGSGRLAIVTPIVVLLDLTAGTMPVSLLAPVSASMY